MEILAPKYRRDPNAKVHSAYVGVAPGNRTVTRITQVSQAADGLSTSRVYGTGIPRGQGGRVATIVLAGMETTLDEVEYMLEGIREKKFIEKRSRGDIVKMCKAIAERRNEQIKYWRRNPTEAPQPKPRKTLYLPRNVRMVQTPIPGFKIAMKV